MLSKACIVGIYQRKLEYVAQQGVDLLVLVPPSWKDERGEQHLERVYTEGYRLQQTPIILNGRFHLHLYPQLGDYIHEFKPDIVHIDEEPYNLASWQALFYAKHIRAKALFFSWQNIARTYPPPFSWGERWVLQTVDYALMGTDSAGEVWRQKGYRGPMTSIPQFGTDPELFRCCPPQADRAFTIGYVGRLVEEKGIHHLLRAAAQLNGAWQIRLVGGGPLQSNLEILAEDLGIRQQITFVGQIPSTQMPAQYQLLDTLVLPSLTRPNWKEQFGRVLVEAMASCVPVIGSDSGAIPGVIAGAGLIFSEGDVDGLTAHLQLLQQKADLRQIFGMQGRKRILQHFTHEGIAKATAAVYEKMLQ